jgi:hypothetical protein
LAFLVAVGSIRRRHSLTLSPESDVRGLPILLLVSLFVGATDVRAQESPLLLEINGGWAVPAGSFADGSEVGEGTEAGAAFGVGFTLPRSDRFAVYLGFDQQRFGCEAAGCANGGTYVATGFDVGVRVAILTAERVVPWIRGSVVTTRVETDGLPAPDSGVSDLGWGGEAAVGLFVGTDWVGLNPSVSYARVSTDLPGGERLGMRYLTAYVGVVFPF